MPWLRPLCCACLLHAAGAEFAVYYSSGKPPAIGFDAAAAALKAANIHIELLDIPEAAVPLIEKVKDRAATDAERVELLRFFMPEREEILSNISAAGRSPEVPNTKDPVHHGGELYTSEQASGDWSYPRIESSGNDVTRVAALAAVNSKLGRLHIKARGHGYGVDEHRVHLRGMPTTLFFVMPEDGDVVKFEYDYILKGGPGLVVNYNAAKVLHAEFATTKKFTAPEGERWATRLSLKVCMGMDKWNARYRRVEALWNEHKLLAGTNPWIDFDGGKIPRLLKPKDLVPVKDEL